MYYLTYAKNTGSLVCHGPTDPTAEQGFNTDLYSVLSVSERPDWNTQTWDAATKSLIPRTVTKDEVETTKLGLPYERWMRWKNTLAEAQARGVAAQIITALSSRTDQVWSDYVTAIQEWRAAS